MPKEGKTNAEWKERLQQYATDTSDNRSLSSDKPILSVTADTETSRPTLIATSGNKEAIRPSEFFFGSIE
ncbi:hypothetical protein DAPPUDRAFT_274556 [Daphnia pulex]|uniref:Uncharacterized protein n=1 Tax=Daphnia pulex TaxID=6669 RepID=E9I4E4_DAPPU|nr:hypothetical protein DAPPUDRAFT_274556 [Daphnia pulex]|eukprot:EFX61135.1 hypothetical protein DAPPUDRAFT_274556 [Daphnia pulex]